MKNAVSDGVIAALRVELRHAQGMIAATARECTLSSVGIPPPTDKLKCLETEQPAHGTDDADDVSLHNAKPTPYGPDAAETELDALREEVVSLAQRLRSAELSREDSELNWEEAVQKNGHLQMKVTQLKEQLQLARNALDGSYNDLTQSKAETDRFRKELTSATSSDELQECRAERDRLRAELATAVSQKQLLESKLDFLNRDIKHLQSTNTNLKARLEEVEQPRMLDQDQEPEQSSEADSLEVEPPSSVMSDTPEYQSESPSPRSEESSCVECNDTLPSLSFQRLLNLGGRLSDHLLAFRRSNKWYYAVTEKHPFNRARVKILFEELQWHVDFMHELEEELYPALAPSLDSVPEPSMRGYLREQAEIVTKEAHITWSLQQSSVHASGPKLGGITAKVQLISKMRMEHLLPAAYF